MSRSQQLVPQAKSNEVQIDGKTFLVLKNNLYKEAKSDDSIKMVINYCTSRNIDPLLKAVHIVPMWNKATGKEEDTIMPGIGLYRIIAARSGQYAGMSEPIYGPLISEKIGNLNVTYPEWCMITVKKFMHGQIVEFPAKEYWIENYACKGKDPTPNAMWQKRKYGQLAKCAEAQALRKAFPEVGHDYTYEELQGKTFDNGDEPRKNLDVVKSLPVKQIANDPESVEFDEAAVEQALQDIKSCNNLDELKTVYSDAYRKSKHNPDVKVKNCIITAYMEKKVDLEREHFVKELGADDCHGENIVTEEVAS
jgi:phage recombination protein Bet